MIKKNKLSSRLLILSLIFFYLPTLLIAIVYVNLSRNEEIRSNQLLINKAIDNFEKTIYKKKVEALSITKYLAYDYTVLSALDNKDIQNLSLFLESAKLDYEMQSLFVYDNTQSVITQFFQDSKFDYTIKDINEIVNTITFTENQIRIDTIVPINISAKKSYYLYSRYIISQSQIKNNLIPGLHFSVIDNRFGIRIFSTLNNLQKYSYGFFRAQKQMHPIRGKMGEKEYYFVYAPFTQVNNMKQYDIEAIIHSSLYSFRMSKLSYFTMSIIFIWLLSAVFFFLILNRKVVKPITRLLSGAKEITKGNYINISDIFAKNEIGELAKNFNIMADALAKNERKLKDINIELEKKVITRTKSLKIALDKLRSSDNIKTDLFYSVIHDLKNPLTVINGYGNMIINYSNFNEEKKASFIEKIVEESDRLTGMLNEFLRMLREEHNLGSIEFSEVNIELILQYFYSIYEYQAQENGIEFIWDVESPLLSVMGNKDKLEHVISNLLSNAFKFVNEGDSIKIIGRNDEDMIKIGIYDTGPGIDDDNKSLIFQKFKKQSSSQTAGSGLGLYIAQQIVEKHDGKIWVENNKGGKGCTFYFTVPTFKNDNK